MKPNEIKSELVLRKITATDLAKQIGVSRPFVSMTIAGDRKTRRIQEAIAKAIGKPIEEVFPESQEAA